MIDTHCHFDMLSDPVAFVEDKEKRGDFVIGMTNLPSHFETGFPFTTKYKHIRLALGFHPLLVHDNKNEWSRFLKNIDKTSYIGEIGMDFSRDGLPSKEAQIIMFRNILSALKDKKKFISIHSRMAESETLALLNEYDIKNVIFHWYTGSVKLIRDIIDSGYYMSVNEAMVCSINGRKVISEIPTDRILTETDLPYNNNANLKVVYSYLSSIGITKEQIFSNFKKMISIIK